MQKDDIPGTNHAPGAVNDLASQELPSEAACLTVHRSVRSTPLSPRATVATAVGGSVLLLAGVWVLLYLLRRNALSTAQQ